MLTGTGSLLKRSSRAARVPLRPNPTKASPSSTQTALGRMS
jgi:hypothetical protein